MEVNRGAAGTRVVFSLHGPCLVVAMRRDGESAGANHDLLEVAVVHIGNDEGAGWARDPQVVVQRHAA